MKHSKMKQENLQFSPDGYGVERHLCSVGVPMAKNSLLNVVETEFPLVGILARHSHQNNCTFLKESHYK